MKRIVLVTILSLFLCSSFSLAQWENPPIPQPENMEQAQQLGDKAWDFVKKDLPGIVKQVWNDEVMPIWTKMWSWFKGSIWEPYLAPFFKSEIEKRQPGLEEEFEKEKEETKESVKKDAVPALKSLWDKFKELIK
jgi:hypothetical protein